ncbi:hypothetical protein [Microbacterium halophytorum]|uniref:hypothetical protein n=1 Tax=Microbacterium halophytorum TaxID=2067568 RepID=UPI000CFDA9CE|nr:hypothetical protein [Microbacterium halophytorum]
MVTRSYAMYGTLDGHPIPIALDSQSVEGRWRLSMTSRGSGTHQISLATSPYDAFTWRESVRNWWTTLCEFHDGVPMYAGPVRNFTWSAEDEILELETVTADTLFEDRYPFSAGEGAYGTSAADFQIVSMSLRGALAKAVQRGIGAGMWDPAWDLPLDIPYLGEAGNFSHLWEGEDWTTIDEIIDHIRSKTGGPDLALVPKIVNGYLRYDVMIGDPRIAGPTIDLPMSVRSPRGSGLKRTFSGEGQLSRVFARGEGYGEDRPVEEVGPVTGPPMAAREAAVDLVAEDGDLRDLAESHIAKHRSPSQATEFRLHAEQGRPALPRLRLGTRFHLTYSGDRFLAPEDGMHYTVGLSYSSTDEETYEPEVVPL